MEALAYTVCFGHERPGAAGTQWLASYAIKGLDQGAPGASGSGISRYDQVMGVMDELPKAEGANRVEILPRKSADSSKRAANRPRTTTASGIVAELVGYVNDGGEWVWADRASSDTAHTSPLFPPESIFC